MRFKSQDMNEEHQVMQEQEDGTDYEMVTTITVTKVEPDDITSTEEASLYADHLVKEDMVIGPTVLLRSSIHCAVTDHFMRSTEKDGDKDQNNDDECKENRPMPSNNNENSTNQHKVTDQLTRRTTGYADDKANVDESKKSHPISSNNYDNLWHQSEDQFQKAKGNANEVSDHNVDGDKKELHVSSNIMRISTQRSESKIVRPSRKAKKTQITKVPSKLKLICDYCQKGFDSKKKLIKHVHNHKPKTSVTCDICLKTFTFKCNLARHMMDFHSEKKVFTCDQCHKQFKLKRYLGLHISTVHKKNIETFTCGCGKTFHNKTYYTRHWRGYCKLLNSPETDIFACNICQKVCSNVSSNIMRISTQRSESKIVRPSRKAKKTQITKVPSKLKLICDYCQKGFDSKKKLIKHVHNHKPKTSVTCDICLKTFTFKCNLARHMMDFHSEKKVFTCDQCHKQFKLKRYLGLHISTVHKKNIETFTCGCGKTFHKKTYYTRHWRGYCKLLNSPETDIFACNICQKVCSNKRRLNIHMKSVHYAKFYCDYCNKCVKDKRQLIGHIAKNHIKLILYTCEICGKKFTYSKALSKHLITHTGKKPFSCKKCKKLFKSKWGFQCHEKRCTYV